MSSAPRNLATFTPPAAPRFRATVHGLAFADRSRHLADVHPEEELYLIPDLPEVADTVWVHVEGGQPLGHLPEEIGVWLAPWMREGGTASARVLKVGDATVPSWKRLLLEVVCA